MRKEAESHADEDRQRKELIEARNNADNMAYAAEKAIKEHSDKVPAQLKSEIESLVSDVRLKAQGPDVAEMTTATKALGEAIQKIGAAAYQQTDGSTGGGKEPEAGGRPDVVDGEVKE